MSSSQKDKVLDREISYEKCSKSLNNNKTGGNDGLVGECFKYCGKGMANLLTVLYEVVWTEDMQYSYTMETIKGLLLACIRKVILRT